ncbi:MAG: cytochrome c [Nitrosomonas sp.]|nr:cytochrome c [Nitrosomonas sp.]
MKKMNIGLLLSLLIILVGCGKSNDFVPGADDSGERIFSTACTECHKPLSQDVAMLLSEKMANKEAIINKVQTGSMRMPAFKNIQGEAADRLAEYILTHSDKNR